jgi:DNA-binding transcriptional regulator of glucitol operon
MGPEKKRAWGIGVVVFFLVMCAMIAWSQWYAYHVNVPKYQAQSHP